MELLGRAIVAALILTVVVVGAFLYAQHISVQQSVTQSQALSLVQGDIAQNYPGAMIDITNVSPSLQYPGSWYIVASIITNSSTPCPGYFIYSFTYPKFGFEYTVQNMYTQGCKVYAANKGSTIIGSYPVAIVSSYDSNSLTINRYINKFGFSSVVVSANYRKSFFIFGQNYTDVWLVNYSAPSANYSAYMLLSQINGTALLNYTANK